MAFVLELQSTTDQPHLRHQVVNIVRRFEIPAIVQQRDGKIITAFKSDHPALQTCIESIAEELSASCFLQKSRHYSIEGEPDTLPTITREYPMGLGLCPSCHKALFDPSSRRYYYPFTSCSHCGGQHGLVMHYPFTRENSALSPFHRCPECLDEVHTKGRYENHHLNTCHTCGVPVRLFHKQSERYANDAGSFRTLFEVAAKALQDGHTLRMKSTMGYRFFSKKLDPSAVLMVTKTATITEHFSMIEPELHALLGIERPILRVAVKSPTLKESMGFSAEIKYPDDGFAILLAKELERLNMDWVGYQEVDETTAADFIMEFDLPINVQRDLRLFINKEVTLLASGERVIFPKSYPLRADRLSYVDALVGIPKEEEIFFDQLSMFASASTSGVVYLEGDDVPFTHSNMHSVSGDEAALMSVIAEHDRLGKKVIGAYFEKSPSVLYYDGRKVMRIVPPVTFNSSTLLAQMSALREGSDRLVVNLIKRFPELETQLRTTPTSDLFDVVAMLLHLPQSGYAGVVAEALKFVGKGGLQVDTRVQDNRFDAIAFLASIASYVMADVDKTLLCYSIFESFGDYFSELIHELRQKTKAEEVVICGAYFTNPSIFSRIQRNLTTPPLTNKHFPMDRTSALLGGLYL
jgi:hydrogenase maturation protein HypF